MDEFISGVALLGLGHLWRPSPSTAPPHHKVLRPGKRSKKAHDMTSRPLSVEDSSACLAAAGETFELQGAVGSHGVSTHNIRHVLPVAYVGGSLRGTVRVVHKPAGVSSAWEPVERDGYESALVRFSEGSYDEYILQPIRYLQLSAVTQCYNATVAGPICGPIAHGSPSKSILNHHNR